MLPPLSLLRSAVQGAWQRLPPSVQAGVAHVAPMAGCVLLGAFLHASACARPAKVETRTVEHVVYQDHVVEKRVEVATASASKDEVKTIDRVRTVTITGACEERTHVVIGTQEHATSATRAAQQVVIERTGTEDRQVQQTVTTSQPQWRVGVLAGVDLAHLDQPQLLGPVAIGAEVQRRVIGPVWAGGWGLSSGTVGISVAAEF